MAKPKPSAGELEILSVLWRRGPSTVHQVQPELKRGPHVFRAAVAENQVKRRLVNDLLDDVFEGSAMSLVMQALSAKPASAEDVRKLRELLDEIEGGRS